MARVILACVGTRDPYHRGKGEEFQVLYNRVGNDYLSLPGLQKGPILSLLEKLEPEDEDDEDRIYLLSTRPAKGVHQPTELNGEKLKEEILRIYSLTGGNVIHLPMNDPSRDSPDWNPSVYSRVFPNLKDRVTNIINQEGEKEYLVAYQSGTPQMQAGWLVLVNSGLLPARLLRSDGTEEEIKPIFEDEQFNLGVELLRSLSFEAAGKVFKELSKKAVRKEKKGITRAFSEMAFGYHFWSIFHYAEANRRIGNAARALTGLKEHLERKDLPVPPELVSLEVELKGQLDFLGHLLKRPAAPIGLVGLDLLHSAEREFEEENYTEVLWRCSLLWEFLSVEIYKKISKPKKGFLSGREAAKTISESSNEYRIFGDEEVLKLFSTERGKALHPPPKAVSKETAEKALGKAREILRTLSPSGLKGHPLSLRSLEEIVDLVRNVGLQY